MQLIVGLGNPGKKYEATRHNLGFMVLDEYAKKNLGPEVVWEKNDKFDAEILKMSNLLLIKPQAYMNNSGQTVAKLVNFYKVPIEKVVVIHDDLDLSLGKIKVRVGGSAAGHHGVESVIKSLGNDQFVRLRLGIGNEKSLKSNHFPAEEYVLESFTSTEKHQVNHMVKKATSALEVILEEGVEVAQNQFNQ